MVGGVLWALTVSDSRNLNRRQQQMVLGLEYIPIYQTDKLYREVIETFRKLLGR